MRHPKQPGIIDARSTEEYVVCGVCMTKNRVVSHRKAVRPVCGRCGYPLPDPFGVQSKIRPLGEWISRYRRALAAATGLLLVGMVVWLAGRTDEHALALSGPRTQQLDETPIGRRGAPGYAVAVVVRRETATDTDDERDDLLSKPLPTREESHSDGWHGPDIPNMELPAGPESVVIVANVCAGEVEEDFLGEGGHDGELPCVRVLSYLQQMNGDSLNPLVSPHVVEQIYIDTGPGPRG